MKNAKKRAPSISIRWQLMFFIGAMTLLTVGLIWGIITYALAPKYNATIRQNLTNKASAITAIFDQTDSEISSRDFGVLQLDDDFWTALGQTFSDKKINMDGYCVDFSDSTLRCLKAYESMFPCLLHESSGSFSGEFGYNLNTRQLITFRQELFEEGSLYKIVQIGSTRQMLVGQLSADGKYGIIVSTGMAQITTAAEVLRSILWPVALILLVLDLLFAMLFSRWFTRPVQQLSSGAKEIAAGNYDIQLPVVHHDEIGQLAEDFNHMAAEVKRSAQLEKDILANVSHDLRTPLTLIKGYAETVRDLTGTDAEKRTEQCNIIVDETDYPDLEEVDVKLLRLCRDNGGTVVTNDYNLNKVAGVTGLRVLNINDLANALKPMLMAGEELTVQIVREGKEPGQGVAYLDDGTMIVVENGRRYVGETVTAVVTTVLQTSAGRMIFTRLKPADEKAG